MDIHEEFQRFKTHPFMRRLLEGGTRVQILKQGTGRTPTPEDGVSLRIALFNDKG